MDGSKMLRWDVTGGKCLLWLLLVETHRHGNPAASGAFGTRITHLVVRGSAQSRFYRLGNEHRKSQQSFP